MPKTGKNKKKYAKTVNIEKVENKSMCLGLIIKKAIRKEVK